MKIAIRYEAVYQYEEKAGFSPHLVRLIPRQDVFTFVDRIHLATDSSADIQYRQDLFDNMVATCFYPEPLDRLEYRLELDVRLQPRNPFHFLLDAHALRLPFEYTEDETAALGNYCRIRAETGPLPAALDRPARAVPTVEALVAMNGWLHKNIAYERRDEGDPHPPAETLRRQSGSCRDYAVLFVEVLRRHGLAARLASGFLWENEDSASPRRAENALHAWVETYLPGAGWIGMDPTNGVFCDHHFLPAAVGLSPRDIAPVLGHYYGDRTIGSTLETTLSITETPI
ncbi:MAG TPA: transglutaminase family protein [Terrimicrobiaceae bacterium]|nr:transglutaminase family protein [Terrimicrobiaceae bacterium]